MTKTILNVVGVVFILIGILGFFNNPILGTFEVNALHNIIHLLSGILAFIFASRGEGPARMFSKVFGVVYLLVAILGFALGGDIFGLLEVNLADNLLHLLLAALFLGLGFSKGSTNPKPTQPVS